MYRLSDLSENTLVLRPEGTAPLIRYLLENNLHTQLPQRFYYNGAMFRYEKPQRGRLRQFYQFGVESIGSQDSLADAEIIYLAHQFLLAVRSLPTQKFVVHINSLGDAESRFEYQKALHAYFTQYEIYTKLSEVSRTRLVRNNPLRIFDSKEACDIELSSKAPSIQDYLTENARQHHKDTLHLLRTLDVPFIENVRLVRGLDYYNGVCFEFKLDGGEQRQQDTLLAGGRYDLLGSMLAGKMVNMPALGFAAGIDRIVQELEVVDRLSACRIKIGIVPMIHAHATIEQQQQIRQRVMEISARLGKLNNSKIEVHVVSHLRKNDKKYDYLDKNDFEYAVIVGSDELALKEEQILVKRMHTREQFQTSIEYFESL